MLRNKCQAVLALIALTIVTVGTHPEKQAWCYRDTLSYVPHTAQMCLEETESTIVDRTWFKMVANRVYSYFGCESMCVDTFNCSMWLPSTESQPPNFDDFATELIWTVFQLDSNCSRQNVDKNLEIKRDDLMKFGYNSTTKSTHLNLFLNSLFFQENRSTHGVKESSTTPKNLNVKTMMFTSQEIASQSLNKTIYDAVFSTNDLARINGVLLLNILQKNRYISTGENLPSHYSLKKDFFKHFSNGTNCDLSFQSMSVLLKELNIIKPEVKNNEVEETKINMDHSCFNLEELIRIHGYPEGGWISPEALFDLCPTLLHQSLIGCRARPASYRSNPRPSGEVYGYATLAVLLVSVPPFLAILIVKFRKSVAYRYVITGMLGLGVGSLIGDTFLHLMPQILTPDETITNDYVPISFWKLVATCVIVWAYFVMQLTIQSIMIVKETKRELKSSNAVVEFSVEDTGPVGSKVELNPDKYDLDPVKYDLDTESNRNEITTQNAQSDTAPPDTLNLANSHGAQAVGWMVTIGDLFHNFTDGLAIGGAFSYSNRLGLSTALAIFAHEIPQELGDAALMLSTGWTAWRVLLFNCIAQASAFVGLYIGVSVSQASGEAESWILAVTAGTFIYLALTDAVPEILELCRNNMNLLIVIVPNIGIFFGYLIMVIIALYEHRIQI